jgi:predicted glycoside hydrolase/deacetylase ChbG (UPF0249 family)
MLIINADDWGMNRTSTNNSLSCFREGRITSASAMAFMADSERAAALALEHGLDTGLHLNFTWSFDRPRRTGRLRDAQRRISAFLRSSRYAALLYHPFLRQDFAYSYQAQYEEFVRLYGAQPSHVDGHHHMHLCTNMLFDRLIPAGWRVRRSFTFRPGEKNIFNRCYRAAVDGLLQRRYICTDYFFGLQPKGGPERLRGAAALAQSRNVELMVHPERQEEFAFLMAPEQGRILSESKTAGYRELEKRERHA